MSYARIRELSAEYPYNPEKVVDVVLEESGVTDKYWSFFRPYVLSQVRSIYGREINRQIREEFWQSPVPRARRSRPVAGEAIVPLRYKAADGAIYRWEDMTLDMIRLKQAQLRHNLGKLAENLGILDAAERMLLEAGAQRIGDVPGWEEKIRGILGEHSEAEAVAQAG